MRKPDSLQTRLSALNAKAVSAQAQSPLDFDWGQPVLLPFWLSRRHAASAVTHFYRGELATADMCHRIANRLNLSMARDFLDLQARDEQRHANLYSHYMEKLGGPDKRPSKVGRVYELAAAWQGTPEAIILAYHGILEGESMRLQQEIDKWLPCPLFKDISVVVARDEARHIAFGRLYLQEALPTISQRERKQIFAWIRSLWFVAVRGAIGHFAPPGVLLARGGLSRWMALEWQKRLNDLEALRLFTPEERQEFTDSC
jgi:hypothetical protein